VEANSERRGLGECREFRSRDRRWAPRRNIDSEQNFYGLAGGNSGLAIFYHELARHWPESGYDTLRDRCWDACIDNLANSPYAKPGLYSGFTGVGWATAFLSQRESDRNKEDESHEEVLAHTLAREIRPRASVMEISESLRRSTWQATSRSGSNGRRRHVPSCARPAPSLVTSAAMSTALVAMERQGSHTSSIGAFRQWAKRRSPRRRRTGST
jgi:lanthionine synthetase-like protein